MTTVANDDLCNICLNIIKKGEKTITSKEARTVSHTQCWLEVKEKQLQLRRKNKCKNRLH